MKNKSIGIFGLAKTGTSAYEYLKDSNKIVCFDDSAKNIDSFITKFGASAINDIDNPCWTNLDYIILSPGVPISFPKPHKIVEIASSHNIPLISDIDVLYLTNRESFYIAITGTNGKSTTTSLIGHILSDANYAVAGNIGVPALSVSGRPGYILELSSYQLDITTFFKPNIAVLLNITKDHIDRHGSFEKYIEAKKKIFGNLGPNDFLVIAIDNPISNQIYNEIKLDAPFQIRSVSTKKHHLNIPYNIYLQGKHNLENILVSVEVAKILGYKEEYILKKIESFVGLKHRMEFIRTYQNIDFYNDSKATNADSASKSLSALENIYWIAGGVSKEGGINSLDKSLFQKIKKAYLIGESKEEFANTLKTHGVDFILCNNLEDALQKSFLDAKNDSANKVNLLLAPAAASFDQFKDFEERGEIFTKLVMDII